MLKNKFLKEVQEFLKLNDLLNQKLIVAVSGGVDSMVLLFVLLELGLEKYITVVSFNHNVREDSEMDVQFVKAFCDSHKIEFIAYDLEFKSLANFENKAREKRYELLFELKDKKQAAGVLLAQHKDDSVETILHKFLKGTFITGLKGIAAVDSRRGVYRPLLNFSKQQIYKLAEESEIAFREDESNLNPKYDRNFLRLNVIPMLNSRYKNFSEQLMDKAQFYKELDEWLELEFESKIKVIQKKYLGELLIYKSEDLINLPVFFRFEWLKKLAGKNIAVARFKEFEKFLVKAGKGKLFELDDCFIEKSFDYLIVIPNNFETILRLKMASDLVENDLLYEKKIPSFIRSYVNSKEIEKFVLNSENIG